jgi:hypothetical protein
MYNEHSGNKSIRFYHYLMVGWCILNSGAWVLKNDNLFIIVNSILVFIWMLIGLKQNNFYKKTLKFEHFVIFFLLFSLINSFILNSDYEAIFMYINVFVTIILGYMVVKLIKFNNFSIIFSNIILCIAVISLLFWLMTDWISNYIEIFPTVEGVTALYKNLFIYLYPIYTPYRNTGIFWEPGAYQAFLNIALCFILFSANQKSKLFKIFILSMTILTTRSTTGYILMIIIFIAYVLSQKRSKKQLLLTFGIITFLIYLIFFTSFNQVIVNKLSLSDTGTFSNFSALERFYGTFIDLNIMFSNPIIGVGYGDYLDELKVVGNNIYSYDITVSANTITYIGAILGLIPMLLIIIGVFRFSSNFRVRLITKIIIGTVLFTIFIPENFANMSLLYIIIFYGFDSLYSNRKIKFDQN